MVKFRLEINYAVKKEAESLFYKGFSHLAEGEGIEPTRDHYSPTTVLKTAATTRHTSPSVGVIPTQKTIW